MPSEPVAGKFLVWLMATMVIVDMKGGAMFVSICHSYNCLSIFLLFGWSSRCKSLNCVGSACCLSDGIVFV